MNIMSGNMKWVLVAILVILAGGAIYVFDPLGWRTPPVVAPKAKASPPHVAVSVVSPTPTAPVSMPVSAVSAPVATTQVTALPVSAPAAAPVMAEPAPALQPPLKLSKSLKSGKAKPVSSKSADLRYCLKLATDTAIAKCAGE